MLDVKTLPSALPSIRLHGFPLHAVTEQRCIEHVLASLDCGRGGWVVTHNLDHMRRLSGDPSFARLCAASDLRVADGMPLIWASKLQGNPLPERVAGSSLIGTLTAAAADRGRSIYLLGGSEGTADQAAEVLRKRIPSLKIAGTYFPPMGFHQSDSEMQLIEQDLMASDPDIIYVAVGSPKQEELIARIRHLLPRAWWIGVGISFSFVAGQVRRAPLWMQRAGLEWAHRLAQEPGRLARRYLVDGMPFAMRLLARACIERVSLDPAGEASAAGAVE